MTRHMNTRSRLTIAAAFLFSAAVLTGCGPAEKAADDGKITIVATTGMIGDAVKTIGGDRCNVAVLMGPGVDPHLYKATKGDIDRLDDADIVFYNGLNLEAKMTEILEKMGRGKTTVPIGEAIPDSLRLASETYSEHPDPHIWFDLSLWSMAVEQVAGTLSEMDPANREAYEARSAAYLDTLMSLHQWAGEQMAGIPEGQRVMVTAHDAFRYFGRAYGIEVRGLQGISTVTEAGLQDVTRMVDLLTERRIKAVFVESSVPPNTIEAVVEGCRDRGHNVTIGGSLFSDAMGEAGTPEGRYFGMFRHNINTIVGSLK